MKPSAHRRQGAKEGGRRLHTDAQVRKDGPGEGEAGAAEGPRPWRPGGDHADGREEMRRTHTPKRPEKDRDRDIPGQAVEAQAIGDPISVKYLKTIKQE
jgi:hypothetical protein